MKTDHVTMTKTVYLKIKFHIRLRIDN